MAVGCKTRLTEATMLFFAIVCMSLALHEVVHASDYQEMKMQGDIYPNSCGADQKNALWEAVNKAKVPNDQQALKLIDLILCAPDTKENRKALMTSFGKIVREEVESTGDDPRIKTIVVTEELVASTMAFGRVWNTNLLAAKKKISLQYFVNEACVKRTKLVYSHSRWTIYEIGEACD